MSKRSASRSARMRSAQGRSASRRKKPRKDFSAKGLQQNTMQRNLMRSISIIICGSLGVFGLGALFDTAKAPSASALPPPSRVTLENVLADEVFSYGTPELPTEFVEEIFPLDIFYEVQVSLGGGVGGFLSHDSAEEVVQFCEDELLGRGWTKVESGRTTCASFVKNQGIYTWLLIQGTEISGDTSLIVSYA